ncbi:DUF86 domain-containing protein [Gracilibacillus dipsosauri]|uniref:DUF86 domain-containing protein n=1 Tax=Gracilibacillus dipsosauri TaxID=178340 RepID=A0A317KXU8_9BACI|nr:DUF86 domain-containing protein [Gracilibacillus dipsosauri]PWU68153.1 DUF86 domain-containing protein [Gracilibacillus dipsosauri]
MYFVDMNNLKAKLNYFDQTLAYVEGASFQSDLAKFGLERITQVLIESILDVGNMMIDGFLMRDPGSYVDIILILVDEKVIPNEELEAYQSLIHLRKMLVKEYDQVDHEEINTLLIAHLSIYKQFSTRIRTYLANEMGVANTFSTK